MKVRKFFWKVNLSYPHIKLFANHFKFKLGAVSVTEVDRSFMDAQLLYFLIQMNLFTIYLIAFLLTDSPADLQRCNRTEYFAAGAGFCPDFERAILQFGDNQVNLGQHFFFFLTHL